MVRADPRRLEQMLTNLIDNAIKFNREGGSVTITFESGERDRICVHDTGEGIRSEHIERVFERFYRVDRARTLENGGTGLGLAIVKHLARAHGGEVSVQSTSNEGSTFTIASTSVNASTPVTITATYAGVSKPVTLTLLPLAASSVVPYPASVAGGTTSTSHRVNLNGPAPAGGAVVNLSSSDPATAPVPATVSVAAGATYATFRITTAQVTVSTPVTITATYGGASPSGTLTVRPPILSSVLLSPATVSFRPASFFPSTFLPLDSWAATTQSPWNFLRSASSPSFGARSRGTASNKANFIGIISAGYGSGPSKTASLTVN